MSNFGNYYYPYYYFAACKEYHIISTHPHIVLYQSSFFFSYSYTLTEYQIYSL